MMCKKICDGMYYVFVTLLVGLVHKLINTHKALLLYKIDLVVVVDYWSRATFFKQLDHVSLKQIIRMQ